jgi:hypothetical protein
MNVGWRCGSSGKAPDLQVQRLELKPQSHQKKKKIHMNLHSNFIHNGQKVETTELSMD